MEAYGQLETLRRELDTGYLYGMNSSTGAVCFPSALSLTKRFMGLGERRKRLFTTSPMALSSDWSAKQGSASNSTQYLSPEMLYDMFHGDSLALGIAFQLLLELSRCSFFDPGEAGFQRSPSMTEVKRTDYSCLDGVRFLSEAVDLLEACGIRPEPVRPSLIPRSPLRSSPGYSPSSSPSSLKQQNANVEELDRSLYGFTQATPTRHSIIRGAGSLYEDETFGLQNPFVLLSVTSGVIDLLLADVNSKGVAEKAETLCTAFVLLSRNQGDIHLIQALRLQSELFSATDRLRRALSLCDEISSLYKPVQHSSELIRLYGEDGGMLALAWAALG